MSNRRTVGAYVVVMAGSVTGVVLGVAGQLVDQPGLLEVMQRTS